MLTIKIDNYQLYDYIQHLVGGLAHFYFSIYGE